MPGGVEGVGKIAYSIRRKDCGRQAAWARRGVRRVGELLRQTRQFYAGS